MLSLLMKTFEQIKENGEQNQNVYNIFKVWRTNSECGEQIQNVESFFKVSEKLFKCLYIRDCEHVGEGFN